jgi:hypothetical protein
METFLAKTILEVVELSDSELKSEYLRLRRAKKMDRISEEDATRLSFIENDREARRNEK